MEGVALQDDRLIPSLVAYLFVARQMSDTADLDENGPYMTVMNSIVASVKVIGEYSRRKRGPCTGFPV